jgi:hypothetical protein
VTRSISEPSSPSNARGLTETAEWRRQVGEPRAAREPSRGSRVATGALVIAFVGGIIVLVCADRALAARPPGAQLLDGIDDGALRLALWRSAARRSSPRSRSGWRTSGGWRGASPTGRRSSSGSRRSSSG